MSVYMYAMGLLFIWYMHYTICKAKTQTQLITQQAISRDDSIQKYAYDNPAMGTMDEVIPQDSSHSQDGPLLIYCAQEGVSLFVRIGVISKYLLTLTYTSSNHIATLMLIPNMCLCQAFLKKMLGILQIYMSSVNLSNFLFSFSVFCLAACLFSGFRLVEYANRDGEAWKCFSNVGVAAIVLSIFFVFSQTLFVFKHYKVNYSHLHYTYKHILLSLFIIIRHTPPSLSLSLSLSLCLERE